MEKINIISEINDSEQFYSTVKATPNEKVRASITINRNKKLYDSIIREFQELESTLAFCGGLRKINWNEAKDKLLFDTEEERQKAQIYGVQLMKDYPEQIISVTPEQLKQIVITKDKYTSLTIPKSFFREGKNDFTSLKYINAFYNFYFVLESLCGNGKTKNSQVEKEFKSSAHLRTFLDNFIENMLPKEQRHMDKITEMLKFRNKKLSVDSIIELIVKTRGDLHHFVNNPRKVQGTPFNHQEFETIAWIMLGVSVFVISQKIAEINQK